MTTLEKIKSKITHIDIDELKERLNLELKLNQLTSDEQKQLADKFLNFAIQSALLLMLDVTHLKKIDDSLYGTLIDMTKDYWSLNKYDKLIKASENDENTEDDDLEVSSIKEGDTQVNFSSKSSTININGTKYSTGTINFDENIIREKYKNDLYRHRKFRW